MPIQSRRKRNSETMEFIERDAPGSRTLTDSAMEISLTAVTVGNATDDIDFKVFLGDANTYIKADNGASLLYMYATGISFAGTITTAIDFSSATISTDITKAGNMIISTTGTTKNFTLNTTGDINLNPAGGDIIIGGISGSTGKMTAHATQLTIFGGAATGDDLILRANETDTDAITINGTGEITIAATTGDIALNPTGADITIGGVSGSAGKLTAHGTQLSIFGGDTTGDALVLSANSSADTEAITLTGAGAIAVVNPNTLTLTGPVIEGASGDTTCVALSDTSVNGMVVYAGTPTSGGADMTVGTPFTGIRSRLLVGTAQTNDTSWYSVYGQLRIKANMDQGVHAAVRGYIEESGDTTMAAGQTSALLASIEVSSGFELSAGNIDGLRVESLVTAGATMTGTFSGMYMTKGASALAFDYGIYMTDCATRPIYIINSPAGSTALNMINMVISDGQTHSSGYARGLYVNWTHATGNITGTGEINGIGADIAVTAGDVAYVFPVSVYTGSMGTGSIGSCNGIYVYQDDIGGSATVAQKYCIDLNQDNGDNATVCGYIRIYNHGGASNTVDYVIDFANSGHGAADYFFHVGATGGFLSVDAGSPGANSTHKIAVLIGAATVGYIPVYADY